ncbi:Trafficking protein particle complex subunit 6B [Paragonimus heterotremus]|uniref:Trafficking protein particle complex subunit 6B n=1 Tax=Paragonimus heterotremus TaxID=100268 RepID=A0A8J4TE62_9TREM|nr:Trafficking protein particle complex subunit 6B [Paragonimus heterotremus]
MSTAVYPYDAFDALLNEIVNYASSSTQGSLRSADLRDQFLNSLGFSVSQKLIERWVCLNLSITLLQSHQGPPPICDRTGCSEDMYVLFISDFCLLERISRGSQYLSEAGKYLAFPTGLLKGALTALGLNCSVSADCEKLPSCKFTIKILRSG